MLRCVLVRQSCLLELIAASLSKCLSLRDGVKCLQPLPLFQDEKFGDARYLQHVFL